ncbi:MAG: alternative ribosome rescue aminoacyl-tRNA hydrolase ArfB [Anaerolineae bacterium]
MAQDPIPQDEITFTFARSSGPGGQHVNTADTKAVLRWDVVHSPSLPEDVRQRFLLAHAGRITKDGILVLTCQHHRSRRDNQRACLEKLAALMAEVATPPRRRRKTRPPRSAVERRLRRKRSRGERKRLRRRPAPDD